MSINFPLNLTFPDSALKLSFEQGTKLNRTIDSIVIVGSRGGFLSLSNALFYALNDLEDKVEVHEIPYVDATVCLSIVCDENLDGVEYGRIDRVSDTDFVWHISETELSSVAAQIHSLGHINPELHFDSGKPPEEITVYCVVE